MSDYVRLGNVGVDSLSITATMTVVQLQMTGLYYCTCSNTLLFYSNSSFTGTHAHASHHKWIKNLFVWFLFFQIVDMAKFHVRRNVFI